jgi:hypothetical protein
MKMDDGFRTCNRFLDEMGLDSSIPVVEHQIYLRVEIGYRAAHQCCFPDSALLRHPLAMTYEIAGRGKCQLGSVGAQDWLEGRSVSFRFGFESDRLRDFCCLSAVQILGLILVICCPVRCHRVVEVRDFRSWELDPISLHSLR